MSEQPDFTPCPACGMPCGPGTGASTPLPDGTWVRHCLTCPPRPFTVGEKLAHDKYEAIAAGFERAVRRIVAYEAALKFYADPETYNPASRAGRIYQDEGQRARDVLAKAGPTQEPT